MCGTSNLDLVLNGKHYRRGTRDVVVPSDLETIRRAFDEFSSEKAGKAAVAGAAGGAATSSDAAAILSPPPRVFLIIDEADLLIQTLGQDRLPGAPLLATDSTLRRPKHTGASSSAPSYPQARSPDIAGDGASAEQSDDQVAAADCDDSPTSRASEDDVARRAEEVTQVLNARRGELIDASFHTVLVTATPSALLLLPRDNSYACRLQVAILPLRRYAPLPYFGFSRSLVSERQIQHVSVPDRAAIVPSSAAVQTSYDLLSHFPGVRCMLDSMLSTVPYAATDSHLRVGLIHAVREIDRHTDFQREVVSLANLRNAPLLAITHDSGLGGWGFTMSASACIARVAAEEFFLPASLRTDDPSDGDRIGLPWTVLRDLEAKSKKLGEWTQILAADSDCLIRCSSAIQFSDVLDMASLPKA